jgi:hypothetical protein
VLASCAPAKSSSPAARLVDVQRTGRSISRVVELIRETDDSQPGNLLERSSASSPSI